MSPKPKEKTHSIYALMPHGSMKRGSLSQLLYYELMAAYNNEYDDDVDKGAILAAITVNYKYESDIAWQAFLGDIGYDE